MEQAGPPSCSASLSPQTPCELCWRVGQLSETVGGASLLCISHSGGYIVVSHCGFNFNFSDDKWYWASTFSEYIAIWISSLWNNGLNFCLYLYFCLTYYCWIVGFWIWLLCKIYVKVKVLAALSCLTLCDPMNCCSPGSSVHGILQPRILEWVAFPFSRGYSQPRDRTQVSYVASGFFTSWTTREAQDICSMNIFSWFIASLFTFLMIYFNELKS